MNYEASEWPLMRMEELDSVSHQSVVRVLNSSILH